MRILVLGITGMLGHAVWSRLRDCHETFGSIHSSLEKLSEKCSFFKKNDKNIIDNIDALSDNNLAKAIKIANPDVIINCVGVVKQLKESKLPIVSISLNALLPHKLAEMCVERDTRLIHISTDCVFSGNKGNYNENDVPDANDLYGRTKYLGEVTEKGCLTIRTSIVGRQLSGASGLFEWLLSQKGNVRGYRRAIFSGLTTCALAKVISSLVERHKTLDGLYHVSSEPINKYDLLNRVKTSLNLDIEIVPDDSVVIDRSLDSKKFRELTQIYIPGWDEMIEDFAQRVSGYEKWRF